MSRLLRLCVVLLVVGATVGPAVTLVAAQEETPTPTPGGNETSIQHVDPDETNENGDLAAVQASLARRMAERLSASSVQLSQGQYDLADELVGEEYQSQYGKYVDVAGETDEPDASESFDRAGDLQRDLNGGVEEYYDTLAEYREAKRNGNEQRAQRLARELDRLSANVSTTGNALQATYTRLSNRTGANLTTGIAAVNETVTNVTTTQAEIRQAEFTATTLTITRRDANASFTDPLVLDGRLTTANGTPIAERRIQLALNGQSISTRTNATGYFTATYRPVTLPVGPVNATIRYLPNATSTYLGSQTTTRFTVSQVASTLTVTSATEQAAFGESVTVTGNVTASEIPVNGVPVVLAVGGQRLATGTTTDDGQFTLTGTLPAGVAAGTTTLRVTIPLEDRAIAGTTTSRELTVEETQTTLTLRTDTESATVQLAGQLATADGEGVNGQELMIIRNGSVVSTTQTGPNGSYTATLSGEPGATYRVTLQYDEAATSLAEASASTVVTLPAASESADGTGGRLSAFLRTPEGIGVVLGVCALLVLAGWWWRREPDESAASGSTGAPADATAAPDATPQADPLSAARAAVNDTPQAAVERSYTAIRRRLQAQGIGTPDATHWEFYQACLAAGIDHSDALETLTGLYERAAFARTGVSETEAETALERAADLLDNS